MAKLRHRALREEVIETCLRMNALGINQGTSGNVSARTGEGFLITASGIPYDRMKPRHVVEMDLEGGYMGEFLPSTEWRMHMDIYRSHDGAAAVVHSHSTFATALSALRKDIPAFHYMIAVCGGATLRCADYAEFGTEALSDAMLKALEGRMACLLANHGQIAFGPSLEKALWRAGEVEALCKQYWAASLMGKPVILDDGAVESVLARFKTYGQQQDELGPEKSLAVIGPVRRGVPAKKKKERDGR